MEICASHHSQVVDGNIEQWMGMSTNVQYRQNPDNETLVGPKKSLIERCPDCRGQIEKKLEFGSIEECVRLAEVTITGEVPVYFHM
jgi:hypothetical protein